jgi:hypothetical protein
MMDIQKEYSEFLACRNAILIREVAPYDWLNYPDSMPATFMAYFEMLGEHSRELANIINHLARLLRDLNAWEIRLSTIEKIEDRYELIVELIDAPATLALNLPYVIRSRFTYSIAHLSHQANQVRLLDWKDDLRLDRELSFEDADQRSKGWTSYKPLKLALEKIANRTHRQNTNDFRNAFHHRYSQRIEVGMTNLVTRNIGEDGSVRYGIGGMQPLKLATIYSELKSQHSLCLEAFSAYQKMVKEQIEEVVRFSEVSHPYA